MTALYSAAARIFCRYCGNNVLLYIKEVPEWKRTKMLSSLRRRAGIRRVQAPQAHCGGTRPHRQARARFNTAGNGRAAVVSAVKDAEKCGLGGVCVQPYFVNVCARPVKKLKVVCCISLCGGAETSEAKAFQVRRAVRAGAAAAEVTAPVPAVKEGAWSYVRRELKKLRAAAGNIELRMNAEAPLLTAQEAERLCSLAAECGVKCVRVSHGACDDEELSQIAAAVRGRMTVKSGGLTLPAHRHDDGAGRGYSLFPLCNGACPHHPCRGGGGQVTSCPCRIRYFQTTNCRRAICAAAVRVFYLECCVVAFSFRRALLCLRAPLRERQNFHACLFP